MRSIQLLVLSAISVFGISFGANAEGPIDAKAARFEVTSQMLFGVPAEFERFNSRSGFIQWDLGVWKDVNTGLLAKIERTVPKRSRIGKGWQSTIENDVFKGFGLIKEKSFVRGEATEGDTPYGASLMQLFRVEGKSCFAFWVPFTYGAPSPLDAADGWFCAARGKTVSLDDAAVFIKTISRKKDGKAPAVTPPTMADARSKVVPFAIKWSGKYDLAAGVMKYEDVTGGGSILVKLPGAHGDCTGRWKTTGGTYNSDDKPHGDWNFACSDGSTAEGNFTSSEPGAGEGGGKDADGNAIKVSFGAN